jgi:hypothetical protein
MSRPNRGREARACRRTAGWRLGGQPFERPALVGLRVETLDEALRVFVRVLGPRRGQAKR